MLAEYLQHAPGAVWHTLADGVAMCGFQGDATASRALQVVLVPLHFEVLFCQQGQVALTHQNGQRLNLGAREILLVSDTSSLATACVSGNLGGVLMAVDAANAHDSLRMLCALIGGAPLDTAAVGHYMRKREGVALIKSRQWSDALFTSLDALASEEQGRYCLWKTLELLYLLSTCGLDSESPASAASVMTPLIAEVAAYMRSHLSEHLTIDALSSRFNVSPTALKKAFRRCYGQPIHSWLQEQRMKQAAQLLRDTSMTVLEVAQEVGYSSTSQFSSAFVRHYGTTPGQYRRLSV